MELETDLDWALELQECLKEGDRAYVLTGEQLEQFLAMDQQATHTGPATLQ